MSVKSLIVKHLVAKAMKSATAAVAGVGVAGGAAVMLSPELLDAIPEQYRGYVLLGYAGLVLLARFRGEIADLIRELKNGDA
jgi:hypothetical protein